MDDSEIQMTIQTELTNARFRPEAARALSVDWAGQLPIDASRDLVKEIVAARAAKADLQWARLPSEGNAEAAENPPVDEVIAGTGITSERWAQMSESDRSWAAHIAVLASRRAPGASGLSIRKAGQ